MWKITEKDKAKILMDNERNLLLYAGLAIFLSYLGFSLPYHCTFLVPMVLAQVVAVLVAFHGVYRYLERRKMLLNGSLRIDEYHW